jgi:hypothetical protein
MNIFIILTHNHDYNLSQNIRDDDDDDDVYLDKNNKRGMLKNLSSTCET